MPASTLKGPKSVACAALVRSEAAQLASIIRFLIVTNAIGSMEKAVSTLPELTEPLATAGTHHDPSATKESTYQGRLIFTKQYSKSTLMESVTAGCVGAVVPIT